MKRFITSISVLPVLLALLVAGCTIDSPDHPTGLVAPEGEQLFANYVAIGNSLTAGYMDGGLMAAGQMSSFPRLIAGQLGLANAPGDMEFSQPWINPPGIGSADASDDDHVAGVYYFDLGLLRMEILGETHLDDVQDDLLAAVSQPTPYHNLGVPGATLYDVANAYDRSTAASYLAYGEDGENPFFDFVNRAAFFGNTNVPSIDESMAYETASMFSQCVAKGPSLVTVWIGNNDVLGGATAGTVVPGVTITDTDEFAAKYQQMLLTLAGGLLARTGFPATIVVANIPSIADIPYFWSVANFNASLPDELPGFWPAGFAEGEDVELVRFTVGSWAATANPMTDPIPANYTLTETEVGYLDDAVLANNTAIEAAVGAVNFLDLANCGLVDANGIMAALDPAQKTHFLLLLGSGMDVATAAATTLFSLDGIHPNNTGYAVLANAFIDEIENQTGTTLDPVALGDHPWYPTYGHPGTPVGGKVLTGAMDPRIDGAMANLFR